MPNPVVITRPIGQARVLADHISAMGRKAIIFPLLEIHPLPDPSPNLSRLMDALSDLKRYAMVAFVSPNAIHAAFSRIEAWPSEVPIAVVGEGSRAALASHGVTSATVQIFSPVNPDRSDSETLLEVLDFKSIYKKRVLIVRGESGRELLADALRAHGVQVDTVAAYRRSSPQLDASGKAALQSLVDSENDWLITSSEAMRNLMQMTEEISGVEGVKKLQQQHYIIPHIRIKEAAEQLGCRNVILTGAGDAGLIAALQCRP